MSMSMSSLESLWQKAWDGTSRTYPLRDLPLLIRPVVIILLAGWLLMLGVLGMAPLPEMPINDKIMHFFGMGIATFMVYFVIEVPDQARRIWYYRRAPLILTLFCGFFCGDILSEVVQGWLPWKDFDWKDILANLLGSTVFFALAHHLRQQNRRSYEISRLYQPIPPIGGSTPTFHSRVRDRFADLERSGADGPMRRSQDSYEVDETDVWGDRDRDLHGQHAQRPPNTAHSSFAVRNADTPREDVLFSIGDDEMDDGPKKSGTTSVD